MSDLLGVGEIWIEDGKFTTEFRKLMRGLRSEGLVVLEFEETDRKRPCGRRREEICYRMECGKRLGKGKKAVEVLEVLE